MIIGGNGTISEGQQQQIHDLYMGFEEIAAASEPITDCQFLPKHSNVLEDSPPARRYETNSHKLNHIINPLPNPTPFTIHYISAPELILDSVFLTTNFKFQISRHGYSTLS